MATFGKTTDGASSSTSNIDKLAVSLGTPATGGTVTEGTGRLWLSATGTTKTIKHGFTI